MPQSSQPHSLSQSAPVSPSSPAPAIDRLSDVITRALDTFHNTSDSSATFSPFATASFQACLRNGPTMKAAASMVVLDRMQSIITALQNEKTAAEKKFTDSMTDVDRLGSESLKISAEVSALRKKLAEAEENLAVTQAELGKALSIVKESDRITKTATFKLSSLQQEQSSISDELAVARGALDRLANKAQSRSLEGFDLTDIGIILEDIGLGNHVAKFKKEGVDGAALEMMKEDNLRELQVEDLQERKAILHTIQLVHSAGVLRAAPGENVSGDALAAAWRPEEVIKWVSSQGIDEEATKQLASKSIPGWVLLHLTDSDLRALGLNMGNSVKLLAKITQLKTAVFSAISNRSASSAHSKPASPAPPAEYLCPIKQDIMKDPVIAPDGLVLIFSGYKKLRFLYEREWIERWLKTHNTSPMTNQPLTSSVLVPCNTLRSAIQSWATANNVTL